MKNFTFKLDEKTKQNIEFIMANTSAITTAQVIRNAVHYTATLIKSGYFEKE